MFMLGSKPWFPAIVKLMDGTVVADGKGNIMTTERSVNFTGDFVPLFTLGTPVIISRIENGAEIHRFTGKVYLSDKRLLRISSVSDELLPGSENVYCTNLNLAAEFIQETTPRFSKVPVKKVLPVTVAELTDSSLTFLYDIRSPLDERERFYIRSCETAPLAGMTVEIYESLMFGLSAAYRCRFVGFSFMHADGYNDFLIEYNLTHNKLF